jgi:hypothetical protein
MILVPAVGSNPARILKPHRLLIPRSARNAKIALNA